MLMIWFSTFLLEVLLYKVPVIWRIRRVVASVLAMSILLTTARIFPAFDWTIGLGLGVIGVFRIGNMLRIIKSRMHESYLKQATRRTSLMLFVMQVVLTGVFGLGFSVATHTSLYVLVGFQLLVAGGICATTVRNVLKLKFEMPTEYLADRDLPTVTVAIPARNETLDLEECMRSILANDYPKLEVIVLDDSSQKETADIIRGFAHDGVRFVQGDPPADRWLAKNQAYEKLYHEASGDMVLFCGVDVRLGTHAIRSMVNLLHVRHKSMLSVLPLRVRSSPSSAFIQPMRYWWELALPRRIFNKPPVLSTCWIIGRSDLKHLGGFKAVSHAILPEAYFARELVKTDQYSFVRSSNELDVQTTKNFHEQYETAIRTRYAQIRRRPETALVLTLTNILFILTPFGLLLGSIWWHTVSVWLLAFICTLLITSHVLIISITDPANTLLACLTFPLVAISELFVGYISMIQYEFFTVTWKERNITTPVMHVIPHLPKLPKS